MDVTAYGYWCVSWRDQRGFGQEVQRVFALVRADVPVQIMRQPFHDAFEISRTIYRYYKGRADDLLVQHSQYCEQETR